MPKVLRADLVAKQSRLTPRIRSASGPRANSRQFHTMQQRKTSAPSGFVYGRFWDRDWFEFDRLIQREAARQAGGAIEEQTDLLPDCAPMLAP